MPDLVKLYEDELEQERNKHKDVVKAHQRLVQRMDRKLACVWDAAKKSGYEGEGDEEALSCWMVSQKQGTEELQRARAALTATRMDGIYDVFRDIPDAISQMHTHIKERDAYVDRLERELHEAKNHVQARQFEEDVLRQMLQAQDSETLVDCAVRVTSDLNTRIEVLERKVNGWPERIKLLRGAVASTVETLEVLLGPDGDSVDIKSRLRALEISLGNVIWKDSHDT